MHRPARELIDLHLFIGHGVLAAYDEGAFDEREIDLCLANAREASFLVGEP